MLAVYSPVFLAIPGQARERVLHPGTVIDSHGDLFAAEFKPAIQLDAGVAVNAYCETPGKFLQQGATVEEVRTLQPTCVIAFRKVGDAVSVESRSTYRVSVIGAGMTADIGDRKACEVADISPDGMAVIVSSSVQLGTIVTVTLHHERRTLWGAARLQAVKVLSDGRHRCGLLVLDGTGPLRHGLEDLAKSMQRAQLQRHARAACGY
jgi:hypothetical protein